MIYHGDEGLTDLAETIAATVAAIGPHRGRFDSIVVTGMSGVLVGVPVALALGVPVTVVRKATDNINHSCSKFIGLENLGRRYLLIDDFTATGKTLRRVREVLDGMYTPKPKHAGSYFYGSRGYTGCPDGFKWAVGRPMR